MRRAAHQNPVVKVRHRPFSVYVKFLGPAELKGREAIYIEGANDGNLMAHGTGIERVVGTLNLEPDSPLAMKGQRYPLTKIGVLIFSSTSVPAMPFSLVP